jgi:hypothetical protein
MGTMVCNADHSPPPSVIKNGGAISPLPHTFLGVVLKQLSTGITLHYIFFALKM